MPELDNIAAYTAERDRLWRAYCEACDRSLAAFDVWEGAGPDERQEARARLFAAINVADAAYMAWSACARSTDEGYARLRAAASRSTGLGS